MCTRTFVYCVVYNSSMLADSHIEKTMKDDGTTVEKLIMEFSNGSLKQLRELGKFFDVKGNSPSEVILLGISLLQNFKDKSTLEPSATTSKPKGK